MKRHGLRNRLSFFVLTSLCTSAFAQNESTGISWENLKVANPGHFVRVEHFVSELDSESLEESLCNLTRIEPYFWPGVRGKGVVVIPEQPLPAGLDNDDIDGILSNRRFLKIYAQLTKLPKQEAWAVISAHIDEALSLYRALYGQRLESYKKALAIQTDEMRQRHTVGFTQQVSDNPDGTPTLHGLRYKILALVLSYGALDLGEANLAILNVVTCALEQRNACYDSDESLTKSDRTMILFRSTLYNREILASALLGTTSYDKEIQSPQVEPGVTWRRIDIPSYDTPLTDYDKTWLPELGEARSFEPMDTIKVVVGLGDAEFDAIVATRQTP